MYILQAIGEQLQQQIYVHIANVTVEWIAMEHMKWMWWLNIKHL